MRLDQAIGRRGYRRWYERQLYEGHAYLVTGFLALIMMAIALEVVQFRESLQDLLVLLVIGAAGGSICLFAWRKFTHHLFLAEYIGQQATCRACQVYGKFTIDRADAAVEAIGGCVLHVRCRGCGHVWSIR